MTSKLTITRERLQEIAEDGFLKHGESKILARMALAAMDSEPMDEIYAELYRLREEIKGPDGFNTWRDAAIAEKKARVELERQINQSGRDIDYLGAMAAFHSDKWHKMDPITGYMHGWNARRNHAQPAPVVPDKMTIRDACKFVQDMRLFDDVSVIVMRTWNACRTAMLQENAKSAGESNNCRRSEKVQDLKAGNSPVIGIDPASGPDRSVVVRYFAPPGYVMVPKEPTKKMLIRAVATMSGCAPSLVDESDEELDDIRKAYLDMLKVAPQLTIVANSDESQGVKDDVNKIINILKNGDWSDTHGYRGLKTEAGLALESEIEKIVALIEPSPTLAIDAIDAHLRKVLQETKGAQLLRKVVGHNWTPVSERMPETDGNYWGWWSASKRQGPVWFIKSELQAQFQSHEITHWMPLPAAPQEVKGE